MKFFQVLASESKLRWSTSPWWLKLYILLVTFMSVGSVAELSSEIIKWRGVFRDALAIYEKVAHYLVSFLNNVPYIEIDPEKKHVFILTALFASATARLIMPRSTSGFESSLKNKSDLYDLLEFMLAYTLPAISLFILVWALFFMMVPFDVHQYIPSFVNARVFEGRLVDTIAAGLLPCISAIYLILEGSASSKREAVSGLAGYVGVILLAVLVVAVAGAINSGFASELAQ